MPEEFAMPEEYVTLHTATLALLEQVGVAVESKPALDLLQEAGVRVDRPRGRAYPGAGHIAAALASAPPSFSLYGRHTGVPLVVGAGTEPYVMSGGASVRVLLPDGTYEAATWAHLQQLNTLLDALPDIHILLNQVDPTGDTAPGYYRRIAAEMLIGSPKPCCLQAGGAPDVAAMVRMGIALRGSAESLADRPVFFTGSNAEPPLRIPGHAAEILIEASRAGVPCGIGDYVMAGVTAPATLAGALVQRNAVQLAALVLSQAAAPGAPFYYSGSSGSANLRTLDPLVADPFAVRLCREAVRLGRSYGLPVVGLAATDARAPDAQAAVEIATLFQAALDAGAHIIQGPTSMMDQMMLTSLLQVVVDHDIAGYLLAAHRGGLDLAEEQLALAAIAEVVAAEAGTGAPGADPALASLRFAAHPHTARHLRDDRAAAPRTFARESFAAWQRAGAPSLLDRARRHLDEILATHVPEPLDPALAAELRHLAHERTA